MDKIITEEEVLKMDKAEYYCNVCGQPQEHSFSSECCGAIAVTKNKKKILNLMAEDGLKIIEI